MIHANAYLRTILCFVILVASLTGLSLRATPSYHLPFLPPDTIGDTTVNLIYPFTPEDVEPGSPENNPIYLNTPSNIQSNIEYDPATNQYIMTEKAGTVDYRRKRYLSLDEYRELDLRKSLDNYWSERSELAGLDNTQGFIPKIHIGGKVFETIFGNNTIDIRPQGSAEITFGLVSTRRDDPTLSARQRRITNFDFDEKIQMNVIAKIGDKIEFKTNYNTEATFQFENKLKLAYEGKEDEIIQLIEAGDVSLPLTSSLIRGTQSLFGIKTKLRFGRTTITAVYSQQKSETRNITVQGGAQTNRFELKADEYEDNRHFFVAQYFRDRYKEALGTLPIISSNVNIIKMEVWVTNIGPAVTDNRNLVALMDLGENEPYNRNVFHPIPGKVYPTNGSNDLYQVLMSTSGDSAIMRNINTVSNYLKSPPFNLVSGVDYEKIESARKLLPTEYFFNSKLGFISLNTSLSSDQVLAVAFQYQIVGDSTIYQVGEFSDQGITSPKCLMVKLLKSSSLNTRIPLWKLMMKNVYSMNAYQVQQEDFTLNILYGGDKTQVPTGYLMESRIKGIPLIKVLGLDRLDQQMNPPADGRFDFINNAATQGGTIQANNGRIYFTVLEPFGQDLRDSIFDPNNPKESLALADKYCFDSLYTVTKAMAKQFPDKNKFIIEGFYKSSQGAEISLNALNVPQGSVKVTAGGITLQENVDYTVDYTLGRVRIINEGILNSGTPISISLESNEMFNVQTKRMMGANIEYKINKDFIIGATILNLNERPLTQKVNYGDEPISNTIWGINLNYQHDAPWLTELVDMIPLINTKAPSRISVNAEFAHFIPGHSKAIGKTGTAYLDDFEGAKSTIDLKNIGTWFLASTPQGQTNANMFPEAAQGTGLAYGFNRSKLAWYIIDPLFYDRNTNLLPPNVNNNELSKNAVRQVWEQEVFPNKEPLNGIPVNMAVLNLAFFPEERGPYNYDVFPSPFSDGIAQDGTLVNPETRWGGIMRRLETTDFEATNIEYIEFWMMDPFADDSLNGGELYFNLGDISEDILRDGRKSFENGLPTSATVTNVDTTIWGRVPVLQSLIDAFDNTTGSRPYQDVGYDGLMDADERSFFDSAYIARLEQAYGIGSPAYQLAFTDPSADNYHYFRGSDYDNDPNYGSVLERYKQYNGPDGNSPSSEQSPENYPTLATTLPNVEDINRDNTLSEAERYYQYRIELRPDKMKVGMNYITNVYNATDIPLANGTRGSVKWYQFKVPVHSPDRVIGSINDFNSIRFLRMFLKGFQKQIVCRFATLELVRGEWRKYESDLLSPGEYIPDDFQNQTSFDISTVNIEENGSKEPIPYVIPPGIEREINIGSTNLQKLNEQSMVLKVCNLIDGDARAAFKTTEFDFRQFKNLQMFVHAEKSIGSEDYKYGDLTIFMRIGTDFTENYYEYEIPLAFTPWGTSSTDPDAIWPEGNAFDIVFDDLVRVKQERNVAMRQPNSMITPATPYIKFEGDNRITVLGSPSISDVKTIMIGIRNPKKSSFTSSDDGMAKCAEIWVDELRLTDFNKKGGWAATALISADLADLGRIMLTGMHSTDGFGSLEQKQTERQMETINQFGIDTDIELGKFLPEKTGIKVPMHFDYSVVNARPKYDPLNPDLLFQDVLKSYETKEEKDSVRRLSNNYTHRKNINFMNVRKERTNTSKRKPQVYDIENFNFSYAYSEIYQRNIDIEFDLRQKYAGGIGYAFTPMPKPFEPLSKVKFLAGKKYLALIKDFNFYYLPKSFTFRTDMNREYNQRKLRNKSTALIPMETFYTKKWDWVRIYDLKYDLTKSVKLSLTANANAFIDEPPGMVDKEVRRQNWNEVANFGTMNNYTQQSSVSWDIPVNKLPLMDWVTVNAAYQANYNWTASPKSIQAKLGNLIENGNVLSFNGTANLLNLYNKVPYLKRINSPAKQQTKKPAQPQRKPKEDEKKGEGEQDNPLDKKLKDQNKDGKDSLDLKPKINYVKVISEGVVRLIMSVRKVSFTYSQGNGISLPGFTPEPEALGNRWSDMAPGLGFVFGNQEDIRRRAVENEWLTKDTLLNTPYLTKYNENLTVNVSLEPIQYLKIDVTANRTYSLNHQEYFKANAAGDFDSYSPTEAGSFTMSFFTLKTSFAGEGSNNTSEIFERFKEYRMTIAKRLAAQNPWSTGTDTTGYPKGYGSNSQDVLIPAFLAAYSGSNPDKIGLTAFQKIPLPNWKLTYDGLTKIPLIKKYFKTLTLTHAYTSMYSVGTFVSNIRYAEKDGHPSALNDAGNFIPEHEISMITITEAFNPLIKFDMAWVNSLLTNIEYKRSRNLSFSFVNSQLTEVKSTEFIIGMGYRIKNVRFSMRSLGGGASKTRYNSDINLKIDFSIKNNKTILRRLDEDINQISTGMQVLAINFSADYALSQRLNIRLYFDKTINKPYVSNQYRNSDTRGGIALRFTLAQ